MFSLKFHWFPRAPGETRRSNEPGEGSRRVGTILLIEDEESVRDSLELLFKTDGYRVIAVANGEAALALVSDPAIRPDLVISDYNLSGAMNGVQTAAGLREALGSQLPVIILTGDVRVAVLRDIASHGYVSRKKPQKAEELLQDVRQLLGRTADGAQGSGCRVTRQRWQTPPRPRRSTWSMTIAVHARPCRSC